MKFTTSLIFNGQTEQAFKFYKEVFETDFIAPIARVKDMMPELADTPEGQRVLYVAIEVDGHQIKGNDSPDVPENLVENPQAFTIFMEIEDQDRAETIFERLSQNGKIVHPLALQPWGDHFGHLIDQFGVKWDIKIV